ncbi:MAG: hypoxanthine-guanine phosphoribosyltransferase [Methylobacter sp.]|nr:hypoxanthine-guanine phosphoribosyltransferase [Methylobacter sp.]MDP2098748.1 hypoxanthine-guanine phosphoribosyltransferase [Methylobacter sp.]MDP2426527.1 hypoxanthine-guanine phosphoribosyltransferase [Methylobacter sp.]MDP3056206.1 hypoxanthine-guanine phosphoribosyltransferase [Methylobacter sp.]MDP3361498.1 hypoxanthine-guanine phosphoribosyltransferase [Methylobacter sp.]
MLEKIKHVQASADLLHSEQEVEAAIDNMAEQINNALAECNPLLLCVLNGGIPTFGKLLTRLTMPLTIDSINASRYQNQTSGGSIDWLLKPQTPLNGRTVLIVDDILDEGITLQAICDYCREQGAAAVYSAVLVDKILDHEKPISADFIGLTVENRYLFGYGMDYKGYLRNAPGIYACKD